VILTRAHMATMCREAPADPLLELERGAKPDPDVCIGTILTAHPKLPLHNAREEGWKLYYRECFKYAGGAVVNENAAASPRPEPSKEAAAPGASTGCAAEPASPVATSGGPDGAVCAHPYGFRDLTLGPDGWRCAECGDLFRHKPGIFDDLNCGAVKRIEEPNAEPVAGVATRVEHGSGEAKPAEGGGIPC
jgi:hypothetical protein